MQGFSASERAARLRRATSTASPIAQKPWTGGARSGSRHQPNLSAVSTVMLAPATRDTQVQSFWFSAFSSSEKNTSR
jgi:hypothetical protein